MRKVRFDITGIVMEPRSGGRFCKSGRGGVFCGKRMAARVVIGCVGLCAITLIAVIGGGIIPHTFSSVINAFEKLNEAKIVETESKINFDKNLTFSFQKAPIQYAIPKAKIDNVLSFKIGNSVEDFKFKSISFNVGQEACNSIKRASLKEIDSDEIHYGKCEDGTLKINSVNRNIRAGETSEFVLGVSLNDQAKVGQHLNFVIDRPQDIEMSVDFGDLYLGGSYPMKLSTIYVVGLQYTLN